MKTRYLLPTALLVCHVTGYELANADNTPNSPAITTAKAANMTPSPRRFCPTQVLMPALYRATTEAVITYEASPTYTTTPTQMEQGEQKVKVADGYTEYEVIPAKFQEVSEDIEVERERVEMESIPATYRTVIKRVKTKEATQRWNPQCAAVPAVAGATPDVNSLPANCLVTVPAEYHEVKTEVIDMPPRTVKKIIPAKKQTITRKIVLEPARVIAKQIPPVYASVKLSRVGHAATVITTQNTSRTDNIPAQQTIRPERLAVMPALCEDALNPADVKSVQQQLQQRSYYNGAIDGVLLNQTRQALIRYQDDNQLAAGAVTNETLQKLGLQ